MPPPALCWCPLGAKKYLNGKLDSWKPPRKKRKKNPVPLMLRRLDGFFN